MWTSEYCRDDVGVLYVSPPEQETSSCIYIKIKKNTRNSVSILHDRLRIMISWKVIWKDNDTKSKS